MDPDQPALKPLVGTGPHVAASEPAAGRLTRTTGSAIGALAIGALAVGAVAIGALAIGTLAVRRMKVRQFHGHRLHIDELDIGRLRVRKLAPLRSGADRGPGN
jgi:hypothetical protein